MVRAGAVAGGCSPRVDHCATSPAFPQQKDLGSFPVGAEKKEPHLTLTKRRELKPAEIASDGDPQWPRAEIYGDSWENGLAVGEKQKKK